jgi:hypothetical protein
MPDRPAIVEIIGRQRQPVIYRRSPEVAAHPPSLTICQRWHLGLRPGDVCYRALPLCRTRTFGPGALRYMNMRVAGRSSAHITGRHSVADPLEVQVLDVGPQRVRDPESVEGEQRRQRMITGEPIPVASPWWSDRTPLRFCWVAFWVATDGDELGNGRLRAGSCGRVATVAGLVGLLRVSERFRGVGVGLLDVAVDRRQG